MKNIALLRASHTDVSARNFQREVPAQLRLINMHNDTFKANQFSPEIYDGIIISGSRASVLDEEDWIAEAKKAVTEAVEYHGTPTLGVCWGNQLLAHALGGRVERGEKRELGFREIQRKDNSHPIFFGIEDYFTAFQSHGDYVTKTPQEATLLAENDVAIQAFSYKSSVGVQFHPEVDYRTAKDLAGNYQNEETVPSSPDTTVDSWALSEESTDILTNFIHRIVH